MLRRGRAWCQDIGRPAYVILERTTFDLYIRMLGHVAEGLVVEWRTLRVTRSDWDDSGH